MTTPISPERPPMSELSKRLRELAEVHDLDCLLEAADALDAKDERIAALENVCDAHVQADKESAARIAAVQANLRTSEALTTSYRKERDDLQSRLAAAEARAEKAERDAGRFNELFEKDYTHLYSDYWTQRLNEPNSPPSASEAAFLAAIDAAIAAEKGEGT